MPVTLCHAVASFAFAHSRKKFKRTDIHEAVMRIESFQIDKSIKLSKILFFIHANFYSSLFT